MADRNRRLIAGRTGWPEDAANECERIEGERPDLEVTWRKAWHQPGFEAAEGFYAAVRGTEPGRMVYPGKGAAPRWVCRPEWYGATAAELEAALHGPPRSR